MLLALPPLILLSMTPLAFAEPDAASGQAPSQTGGWRVLEVHVVEVPPAPPSERITLTRTLDNGLEITVLADPDLDLVAIQHWVEAGAAHEEHNTRGASLLVEDLLVHGTVPASAFVEFLEKRGGTTQSVTGLEHTVFSTVLAPEYLAEGLRYEAARFARLDMELDRYAEVQHSTATALTLDTAQHPFDRLNESFGSAWLSGHPYAQGWGIGSDDLIALDSRDCVAFFRRHYRPQRMHVVVAGPVDPSATATLLEHLYGGLRPGDDAEPLVPALTSWDAPEFVELVDAVPAMKLSMLAYRLPPPSSADYWAVQVMLRMLSGPSVDAFGMSHTMQKGAANGAWTDWQMYRAGGALLFAAENPLLRPIDASFRLMETTVSGLHGQDWLTEERLDATRASILVDQARGRWDPEVLATRIGLDHHLRDVTLPLSDTGDALAELHLEDVRLAWHDYVESARPIRVYMRTE